jgi:DNA polymerase-3 subunit epsilon
MISSKFFGRLIIDFVALDFETANPDMSSVCQVGIAEYKEGVVVKSFCSLVNPLDYFAGINVSIHGIDAKDVVAAPTFNDIYPKLVEWLQGELVVTHTPFDRGVLRQASTRHILPLIDCRWLDSARVARRTWPACARAGYGLASLASTLGIEFDHHNALEDAKTAGAVLLKAIAESGVCLGDWTTKSLAPLPWGSEALTGPIHQAGNPAGVLYGENLVFTGALHVPRREAAEMASRIGCTVTEGVAKNTSILVVGDQDITRMVSGESKSSKHRKAEGLIEAGIPIRIIGETDFMAMCNAEAIH